MTYIYVGGKWNIRQKNGYVVEVSIDQNGQNLSGFCTHSNRRVRSTEATGFVNGDSFDFTITWNNGTKGHYTGQLEAGYFTQPHEGILKGVTHDINNPGSSSSWESDRTFQRP